MNIVLIAPRVIRLHIYNLLGDFDGHWQFYYRLPENFPQNPGNPAEDPFLLKKIGDYGNLVSYIPIEDKPRKPTAKERRSLTEPIQRQLNWLISEMGYQGRLRNDPNRAFSQPWYDLGEAFEKERNDDEAAVQMLSLNA